MKALKEKVKFATILGTFQSTLVNFKYLTRDWAKNTEEERLLGVSLTGIMDNTLTNGKAGLDKRLDELRKVAIATNAEWADKIGINQSVSITCVKHQVRYLNLWTLHQVYMHDIIILHKNCTC